MPITIDCPSCNRKLRIPDELLTKQVKCPSCGTTFTASAPAGETESARAAPPAEEPPQPSQRRPPPREPEYKDEPAHDDYDDEPPRRSGRRSSRGANLTPHRGTTIMVLGILSLFVLGIILGPIAWVMGNNDLKEIRAGRMDPEGESNTNTGRICGMIATILHGTLLVCCCLVTIISAIGSAGGH